MPILNSSTTLYLNVSCGFLTNKKKNINTHGYAGKMVDIYKKEDEYEGQSITKICVKMKDENDETAIITFSEESWFSHGFFSRIMKADFTKTIVLGCSGSEKNEKISFCWMKQGSDTIKKEDTFPAPEKKTIGKKEMTDWGSLVETIDTLLPKIKNEIEKANKPESDDLPFN